MRHTRSTLVRILANAATALTGFVLFLMMEPTAQAQTTVYTITNAGAFGTLNLSTGAFTQIGNPGVEPAGMAELGTNLYISNAQGNTLYQVDYANGTLTPVGNGSIVYKGLGATTSGLYAVGTDANLYSINAATGVSTLIGPTGLSPNVSAMSGNAGVLYAAVYNGTSSILYSLNTSTGAATTIGNTDVGPMASMVFASGLLYGATNNEALYTLNTETGAATFVANLSIDAWGMAYPASTFRVLHNFTGGLDGANPFAGLIMDTAGNLYGTAGAGGSGSCSYSGLTGCGTVFKIAHSVFTFAPLYSFHGGTDGEFSVRPLTIGPNGSLYGATLGGGEGTDCTFDGDTGCGVVFNLTPSPTFARTPLQPWTEHVLYRFAGQPDDGGAAFTTLIFDSSGNIYGTTYYGGTHNDGSVFKLTPSGGGGYTESLLYSFAGGNDGANPLDGLIVDSNGNYYGTTAAGGSTTACMGQGCGTVFKLTPIGGGNYMESVIYAFQGGTDGLNPNAGVAMDSIGNLYGNTWQGGSGGGGTVYELLYPNWTFSLLHSFVGNGYSVGRMLLDSSGNLYGVLQNGGAFNNAGQAYELTPSNGNWFLTDLYDFTGGSDGGNPIGGVVRDSSGNLYGTALFGGGNTCGGGSYTCGDAWRITPN